MTKTTKRSLVKPSSKRFVLNFEFRYLDLFRIWCLGFGIIVTALDEKFLLLNPGDKAEIYVELCEKYLSDAEDLLSKKDSVQAQPFKKALTEKASQKGWGAASQILKAMAAKEGKELSSHRELWGYVPELRKKYDDEEISVLWHRANALHTNFYENWMPLEEVELAVRDVKRFVEKIRGLMKT